MRHWLVAAVLLTSAIAYSQSQLPARDMSIAWDRGAPTVSFSAKDLADERVRRELSGGLRKRLVMHVGAHLKGSNYRLAHRTFSCDVTLDLWEDGYLVRIGTKSKRFKTLGQVLDHCLVVEGLFVGEPKQYEKHKDKDIYFFVRAEFNPISKKQCRELIRPGSRTDPVGPITMSIVRRRICQAERVIEFKSELSKVPQ